MSDRLAAAAWWEAFSGPTRLRILLLCEEGPQNARTLVEQLGSARGSVNYHLAALEGAGLIEAVSQESVRGGHLVSYAAVRKGWADLVDRLDEQGASADTP